MTEPVYRYAYPRPALTVDALIFHYTESSLNLLLIRRRDEPFKDCWAFPGGFVEENETVEDAVVRELKEETGLEMSNLEQVYTASAPGRDPRGWTISVVFQGFLKGDEIHLRAGDDAAEAQWHSLKHIPKLAFDHADILARIIEQLKLKP